VEFAASARDVRSQMIEATMCTRRNAAAIAQSQPISFWGRDRGVDFVCVVLFGTIILVLILSNFADAQKRIVAQDAICLAEARRMHRGQDDSDHASRFGLHETIGNLRGCFG
jgi:hypothetical protein